MGAAVILKRNHIRSRRLPRGSEMKKKPSLGNLKRRAWKLLSELVRRHYCDHFGYVQCVTCGHRVPWKESHAGHFVPKARGTSVYFEWRNIHPQCERCNIWEVEFAKIEYSRYMERTYGRDEVDRLIALSRTTKRIRTYEYEQMIEHYRECLKEVA